MACNFIKEETPTQVLLCEYCKIFKNCFFYRSPPVAASDSPTTVQYSQLGCLFFYLPLHVLYLNAKSLQN